MPPTLLLHNAKSHTWLPAPHSPQPTDVRVPSTHRRRDISGSLRGGADPSNCTDLKAEEVLQDEAEIRPEARGGGRAASFSAVPNSCCCCCCCRIITAPPRRSSPGTTAGKVSSRVSSSSSLSSCELCVWEAWHLELYVHSIGVIRHTLFACISVKCSFK